MIGLPALAFALHALAASPAAPAAGVPTSEGPSTVSGLLNPESAAVGADGTVYVTVIGEREKAGDGSVAVVEKAGRVRTFAAGLDDPHGLVIVDGSLYVADVKVVWKVDAGGRAEVYLGPEAFPRAPGYLNDIAADGHGGFFVSDSGDRKGRRGAVYRVDASKRVRLLVDAEASTPPIPFPNGVLLDDADHLLVGDFSLGDLFRVDLATGRVEKVGAGFGGADGLARDARGRRFVGDWKNGKLYEWVAADQPPKLLSGGFRSAADISLMPDGRTLLVPDMKGGTLTWFPVP